MLDDFGPPRIPAKFLNLLPGLDGADPAGSIPIMASLLADVASVPLGFRWYQHCWCLPRVDG